MEKYPIKHANLHDLEECALLFDAYRVFYKAASDPDKAKEFIKERLQKQDSILFLMHNDQLPVGLAQVYTSYSSVSMAKVFILNDLYVLPEERGRGCGTQLIQAVIGHAKEQGCARVSLSTAKDNPAQKLYEALGFQESSFKFYNFNLK